MAIPSAALPPARCVLRRRNALVLARHVRIRPEDAFLVSYPNRVTPWVKLGLGQPVSGEQTGFDANSRVGPDIGIHRGDPMPLRAAGRLTNSHEPYRGAIAERVDIVRYGSYVAAFPLAFGIASLR